MSTKTYKFAYNVTKEHPYVIDGDKVDEAFNALRYALACHGQRIFDLTSDDGFLFNDPKQQGQQFLITLQD